MEETMPSSCIQLLYVYSRYSVTVTHLPFPVSLLLCSGPAPILRMVLLSCILTLGWVADCLTTKLCISKSNLVWIIDMMFPCSLWELKCNFTDNSSIHTHIIPSVMISCASWFLLLWRGEKSQLWGSSCLLSFSCWEHQACFSLPFLVSPSEVVYSDHRIQLNLVLFKTLTMNLLSFWNVLQTRFLSFTHNKN